MKSKLILLVAAIALPIQCPSAFAQSCDDDGEYLGRLSANPFLTDSTANKFGPFGNPYASDNIESPCGNYERPYLANTISNYHFGTDAPKIIAADGQYLGRLSANPYERDSVSNPFGPYGSRYSPTSINNPYSQYGSPYSPISPNNPYATKPPILCADDE